MCLAIPGRVEQIVDDGTASVSFGGVRRQVSLALVDDVAVGDYVIVHVGFALQKLDADEAGRTLALLAGIDGSPDWPADAGSAE
jgi:hydrogenase expression/formation protein HypC